jgi:hypothetical protein
MILTGFTQSLTDKMKTLSRQLITERKVASIGTRKDPVTCTRHYGKRDELFLSFFSFFSCLSPPPGQSALGCIHLQAAFPSHRSPHSYRHYNDDVFPHLPITDVLNQKIDPPYYSIRKGSMQLGKIKDPSFLKLDDKQWQHKPRAPAKKAQLIGCSPHQNRIH